MKRASWVWSAWLVALLCAALLGHLAPLRWVYLGSEILIAVVFATSLNLLMGYGGMLSFGHAAYYALAAYSTALLFTRMSWSMEAALVAGPFVAALGALVFGFFIVHGHRGDESAFLMLSLAFSQLVFAVIYKLYAITGGDDGVTGIDPVWPLSDPRAFFVFVLVISALSLWLLAHVKASPFGLTLQAIRDNPLRAEFNGVAIRRHQLAAFVIAGFFAGVAGSLYAFFSATISPQVADWTASARPFLANSMGGAQSFWGPALGVVTLEAVDSQVGRYSEHAALAVGLLAIAVGVFMPNGLAGLLSGIPARVNRGRSAGSRRP